MQRCATSRGRWIAAAIFWVAGSIVGFWSRPSVAWTLFAPGARGWPEAHRTVFYDLSACAAEARPKISALVEEAVEFWSDPRRLVLRATAIPGAETAARFRRGESRRVPLVLCDPDLAAAENDGHPAVTRASLNRDGRLGYAGTLLDAGRFVRLDPATARAVLRHEIGHLVGLGHSGDPGACLYPIVGADRCSELAADDRAGFAALYAPREELEDWSCAALGAAALGMLVGWLGRLRPGRLL